MEVVVLNGLLTISIAFLVTALLIKLLNPLAQRIGWLDNPDARKQHGTAIPLTGGVAMLVGIVSALYLGNRFDCQLPFVIALVALCLVGLVDDVLHISARFRLGLQCAVALLMCWYGDFYTTHLGNLFGFGPVIVSPEVGTLLVVICIVGAINAINMLDGVDGMVGGVLITTLLWLSYLMTRAGESLVLPLTVASAIAGYLCFNMRGPLRPRAVVFMGDAGSTMLGLAIAWLLIRFSRYGTVDLQAMPPIVALWLVAVPVLDTVSLMLKRGLRGQSPFIADRDHIHHILMRAGLNDRQVAIVVILIAFVIGGVGVFGWLLGVPEFALLYGFLLMFAVYYYLIHQSEQLVRMFRPIIQRRRERQASPT